MQSDSRKPYHHIQTIASLARVQWRPLVARASSELNQVASCSLLSDFRLHVWNLNRPYLPFYSFEDHGNVTTSFVWRDSSTIYSVGKDKWFVVHRLPSAENSGTGFMPGDNMASTSLDWNTLGDFTWSMKQNWPMEEYAHSLAATDDSNQLTIQSAGALGISTLKNISAHFSKEVLNRPTSMSEHPGNSFTWSGSNVPNNFAAILASLSDESSPPNTLSELALQRHEQSASQMDDGDNKLSMAYFSRKLPRRANNIPTSTTSTPIRNKAVGCISFVNRFISLHRT
jgi:hypothetical protein